MAIIIKFFFTVKRNNIHINSVLFKFANNIHTSKRTNEKNCLYYRNITAQHLSKYY